ncbi:MAG: hypothetical protein ACLTZY_16135 [Alistipes indistinctus]
MLVADNDHDGARKCSVCNLISILLRGFYERYSLGKNAAGDDFPTTTAERIATMGDKASGEKSMHS